MSKILVAYCFAATRSTRSGARTGPLALRIELPLGGSSRSAGASRRNGVRSADTAHWGYSVKLSLNWSPRPIDPAPKASYARRSFLPAGNAPSLAPRALGRKSLMLRLDANRSVSFCDGLTRRDFLHAGAISSLGLTLPAFQADRAETGKPDKDMNCIMLFLVGGPSQIDTWDPKLDAPAEARPLQDDLHECRRGDAHHRYFPEAGRALCDKVSLIRSVYHKAGLAVHDTGHQMMQTGRLSHWRHRTSARGLRAFLPQRDSGAIYWLTCFCPGRSAARAATCRTGRTAGSPGQTGRPVRAQCRSGRPEVQGSRSAAARIYLGRSRRTPAEDASRGGRKLRCFRKERLQAKQLDDNFNLRLIA